MEVELRYDGKSRNNVSDVYKVRDSGSVTVIVYAPAGTTQRPPLKLDIPDWWLNNLTPPPNA